MTRHEPVCRQSSSYRVDSAIKLGPGHTPTHRPRLNYCHAPRLSLGLPRHKISEIGLQRPGVDRLDRRFLVAHPPESGTISSAPDIIVMT
jgi:hypothetical protein